MNYNVLFNNTFTFCIRHKSLWLLGFFTALLHLGNHAYTVSIKLSLIPLRIFTISDTSLMYVAYAVSLISVILIFIGSIAQAALILNARTLREKGKFNFAETWRSGAGYWVKIMGFALIKIAVFSSILITFNELPDRLFFGNPLLNYMGMFLLIVIKGSFICVLTTAAFVSTYGMRFLILKNLNILQAIKSGLNLFLNSIIYSLGAGFLYSALLVIFLLVLLFISTLILLIPVLVCFIDIILGIKVLSTVLFLLILPMLLLFWGITGAARDIFWTIAYLQCSEIRDIKNVNGNPAITFAGPDN